MSFENYDESCYDLDLDLLRQKNGKRRVTTTGALDHEQNEHCVDPKWLIMKVVA